MAQVIISGDFEDARKKLKSIGITLTTHRHKKGGFVCYADRHLRKSIHNFLQNLDEEDTNISKIDRKFQKNAKKFGHVKKK